MGIRVLVASHIRLYREALGRVLGKSNDRTNASDPTSAGDSGTAKDSGTQIVLVGVAGSAADAVEQVHRLAPDVVLLDMAMSDAFSVARQLGRFAGATRIVALGMAENEAEVLNCA